MLKGIIFDFDGVIAESVQVKGDAFAALYAPYGEKIVNRVVEHHEANGGMSRFEKIKLYHESFLNKFITEEDVIELANQYSKMVVGKVIAAPYIPGVFKYIQKCYEKYTLFISTGTPTNEMKEILISRGISKYFTNVYGSPAGKREHINMILVEYSFNTNELLFYGDSNTDLEAASSYDIPFVLIKTNINNRLLNNFHGKVISNFIDI